jgi:3',5'-nucleoside bisphosphate phosphatase
MMRRAAAAGLDVIALTDHDTVAGIGEAAAALPPGLTLIAGMELSCRLAGHSVHLLGYLFDANHPELAVQTRAIRNSRVDRAKAMVARLGELGTGVTWEQVTAIAGDGVIGRPHIARDWIGPGGRAHVRRYALDPADAISLLHAAGGVAVLAHPQAVTRDWSVPDDLISELAAAGLDGVEVAHPDHDLAQRTQLSTVARGLGLIETGGSDDHGSLTGDRIGSESTGQDCLDALVQRASGAQVITA